MRDETFGPKRRNYLLAENSIILSQAQKKKVKFDSGLPVSTIPHLHKEREEINDTLRLLRKRTVISEADQTIFSNGIFKMLSENLI